MSNIYQKPTYTAANDVDINAASFVKLRVAAGHDFNVVQAVAGDQAVGIAQRGTRQPSGVYGSDSTRAAISTSTQAGVDKYQQIVVWGPGEMATLKMSTACATGDFIWPDANGFGTAVPQGGPPSAQALEACPESGVRISVEVLPRFSESLAISAKSASYPATSADLGKVIQVTAADVNITLPSVAPSAGKRLVVQATAATATLTGGSVGVGVLPASGEQIRGNVITTPANGKGLVNTNTTAKSGDLVEVYSDGTYWWLSRIVGTWTRTA
jgi:hypothetical protein